MKIKAQQGFGLVEIMIALTLGIIVMLGITTLYNDSSRVLNDVNRATRITETATYAMDLITSDVEAAGFWGEVLAEPTFESIRLGDGDFNDYRQAESIDTSDFSLKAPCVCLGTGIRAVCEYNDNMGGVVSLDYDVPSPAELVWGMQFPLYGAASAQLNAETVATTNRCGAFDQAKPGSEFVAIRRASTCSATTEADDGCRPVDNAYHLQVHGEVDEELAENGGPHRGDVLLTNTSSEMTAVMADGTVSPVYRYISRVYYVDSDFVLSRIYLDDLGSTQTYLKEELVDGVELLRFEWGIDSDGDEIDEPEDTDGVVSRVTNSPEPSEWRGVIGVTVWMVVRAPEPEQGYTDDLTYEIAGASFSVPDGYEKYRRAVFSKTIELVNIAGRDRT